MSPRVCSFAALAALALAAPGARAEEKTLVFERPLFTEDRGGGGKVKHVFRLPGVDGDWDASVSVTHAGTKAEAARERDRWLARFRTRSGEPLEEDAPPSKAFEGAPVKGEVSTMSGMVDDRWTKAVSIALDGPDGVWLVRLQGGAKTVDEHHDDFLGFARSAKVASTTRALASVTSARSGARRSWTST